MENNEPSLWWKIQSKWLDLRNTLGDWVAGDQCNIRCRDCGSCGEPGCCGYNSCKYIRCRFGGRFEDELYQALGQIDTLEATMKHLLKSTVSQEKVREEIARLMKDMPGFNEFTTEECLDLFDKGFKN